MKGLVGGLAVLVLFIVAAPLLLLLFRRCLLLLLLDVEVIGLELEVVVS